MQNAIWSISTLLELTIILGLFLPAKQTQMPWQQLPHSVRLPFPSSYVCPLGPKWVCKCSHE